MKLAVLLISVLLLAAGVEARKRGQPLDYHPSSIERLWHNATGRNCDTARHAVGLPAMRSWLTYAKGAVGPTPRMPKKDELAAASKITWNANCHELLEPLTGTVRHPLSSPWPCKMRTALEQARDESGSWYDAKYARGHPKEKYNTDHLIIANRCPAQGETDGARAPPVPPASGRRQRQRQRRQQTWRRWWRRQRWR